MNLKGICKNAELISGFFINAEGTFTAEWIGDQLVVNDYAALQVFQIESSFPTTDDVEILDSGGNIVGILCTTGEPGNLFNINELSLNRLNVFIHDVEDEQLGLSDTHTFKSHYLLIHKNFYAQYKSDFLASSPIWGGFTHTNAGSKYRKVSSAITLPTKMSIPTSRHLDDLNKAIFSSNGFDRFLKYYHQLELLFDVIFVSKIRGLPKSSIEGFGAVVKDYQRKELESLKNIFKDYITHPSKLLNIMSFCAPYTIIMEAVFQDHSKDGNPISPEKAHKWPNFLSYLQGADKTSKNAKALDLINQDKSDLLDSLIIHVSAYWIYRIRCSIAHNKIGEFMFNDSHEEFVAEIGERLLKEALQQIFSNQQLEATLSH
jgi:hypothetical protein